MKTITRNQLVEIIEAQKGTEMVSVYIGTDPRMNKTGNPYIGAMKYQTLSGIVGYDYQNSVNAQLAREGKEADFVAEPRQWGVRVSPKWVMHNDARYLTLKVQGSSAPTFILDGKEVDAEAIKPYLPKKKSPATQADLEKKVKHTDIKIDNIISINMKGETFMVQT
jgi:Tol biopolymer transport system component